MEPKTRRCLTSERFAFNTVLLFLHPITLMYVLHEIGRASLFFFEIAQT